MSLRTDLPLVPPPSSETDDTVILCRSCADRYGTGRWYVGTLADNFTCSWCGRTDLGEVFFSRIMYPVVRALGPVEFNTCTELAKTVIYDVNGYYAELGVHPKATRAEIKRRYLEINGQESPRLTYIVKQLLNPETRARYDGSPEGYAFWDQYVAAAEYDRVLSRVPWDTLTGEQEDSMLSDIYHLMDLLTAQEESGPQSHWGHYDWQIATSGVAPLLDQWRGLLSSQIECKMYISVGVMGRHMPEPYVVSRIGYRTVVFLRDGESPSQWAAQAAAEARALATTTTPQE